MESEGKKVVVYHATPLCKKCHEELSRVRRAAAHAGTTVQVKHSLWKRLSFGMRFLIMPVVVVNDRPFSVLGAFSEETLSSELLGKSAVTHVERTDS